MNTSTILAIFCQIKEINLGYLAGIIVAFLILAYLVYALFKPEKF